MHCQTLPKVPTVDLTKRSPEADSASWVLACKEVRQAFEEFGCFVVIYDKVPFELKDQVFLSLKELFDLPLETKMKNSSHSPYMGYIGQIPSVPRYEGLDVEDGMVYLKSIQSFTNLMWPNGNQHFYETIQAYSKLVIELDQMVTKMLFESYGLTDHYDSHVESLTYMRRLNKCHVVDDEMEDTSSGLRAHTDKNFITILDQNQVQGLQIKMKDGLWIDVEFPVASSFVVMAGETFMAWSNGRVDSCEHRVTLPPNKERYSIGNFSYLRGIIQIPKQFVDEEHPLQYKSFDALKFHEFCLSIKSKLAMSTVKAFCGV